MILLEVSVVGVRALPLLAGRVLHALAHQMVAHVADALQRVREVRADLEENIRLVQVCNRCPVNETNTCRKRERMPVVTLL